MVAPFVGARLSVPALFVAGEKDPILTFRPSVEALSKLASSVPGLQQTIMLPGCGHWTPQERPAECNAAMLAFLSGL
jgi:pimeloyl-ACP methyl ester carboxylesterase